MPSCEEDWRKLARGFETQWNFNHCIGAMDGKHIVLQAPINSGSYYFNYKHNFSIVLLAVVDSDYKFTYIDVGCNGRASDGGVLKNSTLNTALTDGSLHLPPPEPLQGEPSQTPMPYVIVADDAFPVKENIMKPYSSQSLTIEQRIFNYRLSRSRRISENAFGILASRWRIFLRPIPLEPDKAEVIVLAACALHNYLRSNAAARTVYTPEGYLDKEHPITHEVTEGKWQHEVRESSWHDFPQQGSNNYTRDAKAIRNIFCQYFNSEEDMVSWQRKMIGLKDQ